MPGVSWLILLVGLAFFCCGSFAFVTHRMFWQRAGDDQRLERPANAVILISVGAPLFFITLTEDLAPHEYRLPLEIVAAVAVSGSP
jgi:hypothetical protein